ncbi:MAG: phosphatidylglycerophosphatase A family protein [Candidatus Acidulodesulfobacterium sp.]
MNNNEMNEFKKNNPFIFASSFLYIGFFPYGPGTAGSIAAFLLYIFLLRFLNPFYYIAVCTIIFIIGVYVSSKASKISGLDDPPFVVIDEVLGYLSVMSGLLWMHFDFFHILIYSLLGLLLFRIFDISKPLFIGTIDKKIRGGLGIMLDDVAAAFFSVILLRIAIVIIAGF